MFKLRSELRKEQKKISDEFEFGLGIKTIKQLIQVDLKLLIHKRSLFVEQFYEEALHETQHFRSTALKKTQLLLALRVSTILLKILNAVSQL